MIEAGLSGLTSEITALLTVVGIDVALAGDNAVVIGMAASGLPSALRRRAILMGIGAAAFLRVCFALVALQFLAILGLTAAGGLLLLWVAWKLWHDLRAEARAPGTSADRAEASPAKTLGRAFLQILVADLSMSLDNVLAVAGAARDHTLALVVGLGFSVLLMAVAAEMVTRLIKRYRGIAYAGLILVVYVALSMIWEGSNQVWAHFAGT